MPLASWFPLHWYGPDLFHAVDGGEALSPVMDVRVTYDVRVLDTATNDSFAYVTNGTRIGCLSEATGPDFVFAQTNSDVRTISDPSNFSPGELADGVGSIPIEAGLNLTEAIRLMLAALAGKVSGAETTTITFRNPADTKDRIVATVDASGNRTAVTTDVS